MAFVSLCSQKDPHSSLLILKILGSPPSTWITLASPFLQFLRQSVTQPAALATALSSPIHSDVQSPDPPPAPLRQCQDCHSSPRWSDAIPPKESSNRSCSLTNFVHLWKIHSVL